MPFLRICIYFYSILCVYFHIVIFYPIIILGPLGQRFLPVKDTVLPICVVQHWHIGAACISFCFLIPVQQRHIDKLPWALQWLKFIISWFCGSGIQAQLNCTPVQSHKVAIKVWPGLGCHWDSIRERIYFQAHLDYWENSFPWGPWFLDKRPPTVPCHMDFSNMAT